MTRLKLMMTAALLSTSLSAPTLPLAQQAAVADDPSLRINLAGRQRMLSQRMSKAACLMAQDIDATLAFDQLTQAYSLYASTDVALRSGDADLGLAPETHDSVLSALGRLDGYWETYKAIVEEGIDSAVIENADLATMNDAGLNVLKFMNIAVYKTARAWASDTDAKIDLGLAITIDIAGRQRMLTQLAVKNACMMRVAADPTAYADRLANTIELFDSSLLALQDGFSDIGVVPPPNAEVGRTLREVAELWQPIKRVLDRAAAGEVLSDRDLSMLARDSELLLRTMNEAVGQYSLPPTAS